MKNKYTNSFEWYFGDGPIVEIREYVEKLTLEIRDLEQLDYLCFDEGNKIYHILKADWDEGIVYLM